MDAFLKLLKTNPLFASSQLRESSEVGQQQVPDRSQEGSLSQREDRGREVGKERQRGEKRKRKREREGLFPET